MCEHKGASIVKSIAEHSRAAGISVVLFGDFEDGQKPDGIKVIGEYQRDELSNLVQSEEIDVIFFPEYLAGDVFVYMFGGNFDGTSRRLVRHWSSGGKNKGV